MLKRHSVGGLNPAEHFHSLFKRQDDVGRIEDHVANLLPQIGLVLATDNAARHLELLPRHPQLAVEWSLGKTFTVIVRCVKHIAQTRNELLAVPIGTNAVKFLAHVPTGNVRNAVPGMGQEQRRNVFGYNTLFGLLACRRSQRGTNTGILRVVSTQLAEMLAGPAFNGKRLITPSRATAGVHAAHVF
jgi:hypothetical protein